MWKTKTPVKSINWGSVLAAFVGPCTLLHMVDHDLAKTGTAHLRSTFHETGKVIGDFLGGNRIFHRADDEVSRFDPAHVAQHHFSRQDQGAGIHIVFTSIFGSGAVGGFKHGNGVAQVGARCNADAADLGCQRVGNVVAVQVQRGNHAVLGGAQQNLLQEGVGNARP